MLSRAKSEATFLHFLFSQQRIAAELAPFEQTASIVDLLGQ